MDKLPSLKEVVTTVISLVIIVSGLIFLYYLFQNPADQNYERKRELFVYVWGLMGPVVGYYFGRVPAELSAERADRKIGEAISAANSANNQLQTERATFRNIATGVEQRITNGLGSVPEAGPPSREQGALLEAREELRRYLRT